MTFLFSFLFSSIPGQPDIILNKQYNSNRFLQLYLKELNQIFLSKKSFKINKWASNPKNSKL